MSALNEAYLEISRRYTRRYTSRNPNPGKNELAELVIEGGAGSALLPPELILKCRAEIMGDPGIPVRIRDWAKHELLPPVPVRSVA